MFYRLCSIFKAFAKCLPPVNVQKLSALIIIIIAIINQKLSDVLGAYKAIDIIAN